MSISLKKRSFGLFVNKRRCVVSQKLSILIEFRFTVLIWNSRIVFFFCSYLKIPIRSTSITLILTNWHCFRELVEFHSLCFFHFIQWEWCIRCKKTELFSFQNKMISNYINCERAGVRARAGELFQVVKLCEWHIHVTEIFVVVVVVVLVRIMIHRFFSEESA